VRLFIEHLCFLCEGQRKRNSLPCRLLFLCGFFQPVDLFQGQLRSEVKCVECGKTSVSYDPFMNITLVRCVCWGVTPFRSAFFVRCVHQPVEVRMLDKTMRPLNSLYDCLRAFTSEEVLSARNMWKCPRCEHHVRAVKKLSVWRLPPLLIIHLKRFSYNRYGVKRKVNSLVDFPMDGLDLSDFVSPHSGETPSSSKYRAVGFRVLT
jgi:ubiquitin C-terminal hydrolase